MARRATTAIAPARTGRSPRATACRPTSSRAAGAPGSGGGVIDARRRAAKSARVRVHVARGQCGTRLEAELGARRARLRGQGDGVRSRCCCEFRRSGRETKGHGGRTSEEGIGSRTCGRQERTPLERILPPMLHKPTSVRWLSRDRGKPPISAAVPLLPPPLRSSPRAWPRPRSAAELRADARPLEAVPALRRPRPARSPGAHVRAAGEVHRLQEGPRDAGPLRGRGLHLLRPRGADPLDRPLRPGARARRSSSTRGPASTAPCSTSCAARTGPRARVRRWERDIEKAPSSVHRAARPPARRSEELADVDRLLRRGAAPARATRSPAPTSRR